MATTFNTPNYAFLIEVATPGGKHVEFQYIEQLVTHPSHVSCLTRIQNQVQERLHKLHDRTGLNYYVIGEGTPETVKAMMERADACPF